MQVWQAHRDQTSSSSTLPHVVCHSPATHLLCATLLPRACRWARCTAPDQQQQHHMTPCFSHSTASLLLCAHVCVQVGQVHSTRPTEDDGKTLKALNFQTGDFLDVAIL